MPRGVAGAFPGSSVVKTLPSSFGGACSVPDVGAENPHTSCGKPEHKQQSNIVTNSTKTLKKFF